MKSDKSKVSRRAVLSGVGVAALGAGMARVPFNTAVASDTLPSLPWDYAANGLDVDEIRIQAFCLDQQVNCGYGGAQAIINALADQVGEPWSTLPDGLYSYAGGGVLKWGTICGSLNGIIAVMGMLGVHGKLGDALMDYYCTADLPTPTLEGCTPDCVSEPLPAVVTSVAASPLCHMSVSKWADTQGVPISDPLKKVRCGRLVGDIAARAVELMNDYFLYGIVPVAWEPQEEYADCFLCHTEPDVVPSQVGKMDCVQCHDVTKNHEKPGKYKGNK